MEHLVTVLIVICVSALFYKNKRFNNDLSEIDHFDEDRKKYTVSVVGESHKNPDGKSRQKIIKKLYEGDPVWFVHEPKNNFDSKAVAVMTKQGQIGYLGRNAPIRDAVLEWLQNGTEFDSTVSFIGQAENGKYGVALDISRK